MAAFPARTPGLDYLTEGGQETELMYKHGFELPEFAMFPLLDDPSAVAALAPSWPLVVAARFLWGIGAAGPRSLSIAMVRDRHEGDAMARLMSMIMAVFLLVPIAANMDAGKPDGANTAYTLTVKNNGKVGKGLTAEDVTVTIKMAEGVSASAAAAQSRIKDIAAVEGVRGNQLVGYGMVMGLNGTGDSLRNCPFTRQSLEGMTERLGVNIRGANANTKNMAAVMVTAELPAFATPGSRIDVNVSSMCDAKSLLGGTLLVTSLQGADGQVYVAGRARSAMPGATALGGWDGYLQTFSEYQATPIAPVQGLAGAVVQFGGAGDDSVQAMTVSGSDLYTAGVENGRMVVRQFTLGQDGAPVLTATRDLGLAQGSIAGIAVDNGRVILTGQTENAALDLGTPTTAHAGGSDVFIAVMSADLQPGASDRLTYVGGEGDDSAADVVVKDGKVWITGASRAAGASDTDPSQGYLSRLDPETGAVEWSRTWTAENAQARPATIAVASGGASVLDRLGLPQGEIAQTNAKLLTQATALRVGDQFTVTPGNGARAVTVEITAKDTLDTLAKKIVNASSRQLKVSVVTDKTAPFMQRLEITAESNKAGAVISSGAPGKDALGALGLTQGLISTTSGADSKDRKAYGLSLPSALTLNGKEAIKSAIEALASAISTVRSAYKGLGPQTTGALTNSLTGKGGSTAYYNTQAANFQAALARLSTTA